MNSYKSDFSKGDKMNGVFLGRLCPIHIGHEIVIKKMIEVCGIKNCLVIIGSSNASISIRNFFSYKERRNFLKTIFPDITVVGLPDYHNCDEWLTALDDILFSSCTTSHDITYYFGGCEEDVSFFIKDNREVYLLNRFDGTTPKVSASEVRDCLIHKRPLDELLNLSVIDKVIKTFNKKWPEFIKV